YARIGGNRDGAPAQRTAHELGPDHGRTRQAEAPGRSKLIFKHGPCLAGRPTQSPERSCTSGKNISFQEVGFALIVPVAFMKSVSLMSFFGARSKMFSGFASCFSVSSTLS